jgi:hypothetical protein
VRVFVVLSHKKPTTNLSPSLDFSKQNVAFDDPFSLKMGVVEFF